MNVKWRLTEISYKWIRFILHSTPFITDWYLAKLQCAKTDFFFFQSNVSQISLIFSLFTHRFCLEKAVKNLFAFVFTVKNCWFGHLIIKINAFHWENSSSFFSGNVLSATRPAVMRLILPWRRYLMEPRGPGGRSRVLSNSSHRRCRQSPKNIKWEARCVSHNIFI